MNATQAMAAHSAEHMTSKKRDVALRELMSLAKMAAVIAVPTLLIALAWI
ncbi:hypothetical protein [Vibrio sinaloensis]|uniref:Uncharacterized protein n=1 Tax=Vibrio sinaloensis DSM 21326 TaxID=945550 RepID=E8M223_PHOS4|nr:hypothetical protein [Vibrio sinaloensis]EGA71929.1 hypothetical protein VISI1226_14053 [Vibrio sinaloensis DSM 21326]